MEIVRAIYKTTEEFPREEIYGLVSQMRRSAISIPSNVAEGFRRKSNKEFRQFLYIALGSCAELETQTSLSKELTLLEERVESNLLELTDHFGRMTTNLIKKL